MILIELSREADASVVRASGKLMRNDYEFAIPEVVNAAELARRP